MMNSMNALFGCFQERFSNSLSLQCMFYTLVLACTRTSSLEVILLTAIKVLEIAKKEPLKQHLLDEIEVRDQRTNLENEHEFERS